MTQDNYRQASVARMKAGLDASGRPIAWLQEFTEKHDPEDATWIAYGISDRAARYVNGTDPIPFGPWRSVDNSHHGFFIESFMDELAAEAKRDPFEYRRDLLATRRATARCWRRPRGCRVGERRFRRAVGAVSRSVSPSARSSRRSPR
jgi:isoquinoline 1-oxidoreductase beta subunit